MAVTGANGQVGRTLLRRLQRSQTPSVAFTRKPVALPACRVVAGPLNSPEAVVAFKEVDYVVHLAGTLRPIGHNSYYQANVETTEHVAKAIKGSKAKQVLFLSFVGANEGAKNDYLRTKGIAERILADTGRELMIFHCTPIIGPPQAPGPTALAILGTLGWVVSVLGSGRQTVAPIYRPNVVSALLAAMRSGKSGCYDLAGPDRMSMDDLARLLNCNPYRKVSVRHLPAWISWPFRIMLPHLPSLTMVDILLRDNVGDTSYAGDTFGGTLTSLRTVWE